MVKRRKIRKKRYRLKNKAKRFLIYFIFFLLVLMYVFKQSFAIYKEFQYQKTYEYKINQVGYTLKQAKILVKKLSDKNLDFLLDNDYDKEYFNLVNQKYFLDKNFNDYLEFKHDNKKVDLKDVVARVNVHANAGWYGVTFNSDTDMNYSLIVNKFYKLNDDYVRKDIENISLDVAYDGQRASKVVIEQFLKMREDVLNELNVRLMVNSSYRSYDEQKEIYEAFKLKGQSYADSYAARPGFSEHQTGLALDITSLEHKSQKDFTASEEYEWLKNNCYKYGFILRYPEGKEKITGYNTESWHFRYVGKELAEKIYNEGITFDEYYAFYIEK